MADKVGTLLDEYEAAVFVGGELTVVVTCGGHGPKLTVAALVRVEALDELDWRRLLLALARTALDTAHVLAKSATTVL